MDYPIIISILIFSHWVGDFAFQTSPMALNKSRSLKWLTIHVSVYSVQIFIGSLMFLELYVALIYSGINFLFHFITDFITSKWASKNKENLRRYFVIIGLDQFIHIFTLVWTYEVLKSYLG